MIKEKAQKVSGFRFRTLNKRRAFLVFSIPYMRSQNLNKILERRADGRPIIYLNESLAHDVIKKE